MILIAAAMLGPIYALFVEKVGGDLFDASLASGVFAFVAGVTTLISGKFSDKLKENEIVIAAGYATMGIGFLAYFWVESVGALFAVQAVIGLGEAIYSPAFDAVYSKHLNRARAGLQWGAWEAMNYFTAAIGAVVGGILVSRFGFSVLFLAMAGLCFFGAGYIFHLKRNIL